jgi:hypothetical protein
MTRQLAELDLECYPSYFLAKFYVEETRQFHSFGMWPGQPLDIQSVVNMLAQYTIVTFNGNNYDLPMLTLALHGADNSQMKEANDDIIVRQMKPWDFYRKWGIEVPSYIDHIDVMEVAPGVRINLKMYMGRLHAPKMQDLPYDPDSALDALGRFVIADYCGNDLVGTNLLRNEVWERLQLRMAIGDRYRIDVRSKSDAQIAEAVFKAQLDFRPSYRYIPDGYTFNYTPPDYIQFVTPQMCELLEVIKRAKFIVRDKEEAIALGYYDPEDVDQPKIKTGVRIPPELEGRDIIIGNGKYRLGIGGLHSQESCVNHHTIPGVRRLRDIDVKSYYPSLILAMGMVPEQLGPAFSIIYRAIYERRLLSKSEAQRIADLWECMGSPELKAEADQLRTEADGLKIVLNGVFGKLFSKWSIFFAPELGIGVTITGQLDLLMLIEMMECSGVTVISANTDGIVLSIPEGLDAIADQIIAWWEKKTSLEMESTFYKSIYQRDVNNYIAIDTKGKVKRKGVFNQGGVLSGPQGKGPNMDICADAVVAYLKDGVPLHKTITECTDIRKFVVLRGVSGGGYYVPPLKSKADGTGLDFAAVNEGVYLGKAVRWYYGKDKTSHIRNKKGDKVATSQGATPIMQLPDTLPSDIDYAHYERVAMEMLASVGIPVVYYAHESLNQVKIEFPEEFHPLHPRVFGWVEISHAKYKRLKS